MMNSFAQVPVQVRSSLTLPLYWPQATGQGQAQSPPFSDLTTGATALSRRPGL